VATLARALNLAVFTLLDARADEEAIRRCATLGDIVYVKASTGQTGQSAQIDGELRDALAQIVHRLREHRPAIPIAVGIGLQKPEQIAALAELDVDMAVVGTKIVEHLQTGEQSLVAYIHELRAATQFPKA
jgi:tryptophan synthase alpha subunit